MMKNPLIHFTFLAAFFLFGLPTVAVYGENSLFRIGTGGKTGVYYPIGKIIAQGITEAMTGEGKGCIGVAQNSAGSIENVVKVAAGDIEAGLVQADVAAWAFHSTHVFEGQRQVGGIRALASLYPEKFQIVTRKDANIHTVEDLRGKRISIDEVGSGTLAIMRIVLQAHGITEKDLSPVYLKPVFTHDKMVDGELQGFVMMAGTPMSAVTQLADIGVSLVSLSPLKIAQIADRYPYLVSGVIPAGIYSGVPETPTIQVYALWVVSEKMDDTTAYEATASLWSDRTLSLLKAGHPQGREVLPQTALTGISIPLHPGAEKYYRQFGFNVDGFKSQ